VDLQINYDVIKLQGYQIMTWH